MLQEREARIPAMRGREPFGEERLAEHVLERDGAVRELVQRPADEGAGGERIQVELHPEGAAGMLGRDLLLVQTRDERGVALPVDQPVLLEGEDEDDARARPFPCLLRRRRALREPAKPHRLPGADTVRTPFHQYAAMRRAAVRCRARVLVARERAISSAPHRDLAIPPGSSRRRFAQCPKGGLN